MNAHPTARNGTARDAPAYGIAVFWISCAFVLLGFRIPGVLGAALLMFMIPVFFGAHEALHDTLIPMAGWAAVGRSTHNHVACIVGFALQGMNIHLLRPGHLHHHVY